MDIEHVLTNGNCHQCGVCVGVCPTDAIEIYQDSKKGLYPRFIRPLCTDCDLCYLTCPGENLDWFDVKYFTFNENDGNGQIKEYPEIGYYKEVYSGYAKDEALRIEGASGGIATHLLTYLLETGRIDGAVVCRMDKERPLEPDVFMAHTREDLIEAQQSKYIPVPTGVILKEILKTDGRFAVVGLPCHVHGIRQAQQRMPRIRKRIVLQIGLFCGFHPSFTSTKFLARRAGVKDFDQIKEIRYRDKTWPGGFNVIKKDGSDNILHPVEEFLWAHKVFERGRCATCTDGYAEFSDISLGDEWRHDQLVREDYKKGWSSIITHTDVGEKLIQELREKNILYIEKCEPEIVRAAQMPKKEFAWATIRIRKFLGLAIPNYHYVDDKVKVRPKMYLASLVVMLVAGFMEIEIVNRLLTNIPRFFFLKYQGLLFKLMYYKRAQKFSKSSRLFLIVSLTISILLFIFTIIILMKLFG